VVVTSFEGVLKERSALEKIQWRYIIIDEASRRRRHLWGVSC